MTQKFFTVYNDTGEILYVMSTTDEGIAAQVGPGEFYIEGFLNPATQMVSEGQIVDLPPKPDGQHYFDFATLQWVSLITPEVQWQLLIEERNRLLAASDYTQLLDYTGDRAAWATYRQQLRDLPQNTTDPANPVWPEQPPIAMS